MTVLPHRSVMGDHFSQFGGQGNYPQAAGTQPVKHLGQNFVIAIGKLRTGQPRIRNRRDLAQYASVTIM